MAGHGVVDEGEVKDVVVLHWRVNWWRGMIDLTICS